jgi:hypothetical protein
MKIDSWTAPAAFATIEVQLSVGDVDQTVFNTKDDVIAKSCNLTYFQTAFLIETPQSNITHWKKFVFSGTALESADGE